MSFELACKKVHETDNAVLVYDAATAQEIWFPLLQVESMHFNVQSNLGTIVVTDWIADVKGLQ